jgi:hypothetical protein
MIVTARRVMDAYMPMGFSAWYAPRIDCKRSMSSSISAPVWIDLRLDDVFPKSCPLFPSGPLLSLHTPTGPAVPSRVDSGCTIRHKIAAIVAAPDRRR